MAFTSVIGMRLAMLLAAIAIILTFTIVSDALDSSGQQIQAGEWTKFKNYVTKTCNQHQITPGNTYRSELPVTVYPGFFIRYYDETMLKTMTPLVKSKCGSDRCICLARNYEEPVDCMSLPKVGCNTEFRFSYIVEEKDKIKLLMLIPAEHTHGAYRVVKPEFPMYDEDVFIEIHTKGKKMSTANYVRGLVSTIGYRNVYYITPHTIYIQFFFANIQNCDGDCTSGVCSGKGRCTATEGLLAYVPEGGSGAKASTAETTPSWNNWDEF